MPRTDNSQYSQIKYAETIKTQKKHKKIKKIFGFGAAIHYFNNLKAMDERTKASRHLNVTVTE